jgi:hypothetical protein
VPADLLPQIGLAAGAAVASGLRLYGTVAALGVLHRAGILHLPAGLEVLGTLPVIVLSTALYVVEFVADKIPAVDTVWDAIHTFVRAPAPRFCPLQRSERSRSRGARLRRSSVALSLSPRTV